METGMHGAQTTNAIPTRISPAETGIDPGLREVARTLLGARWLIMGTTAAALAVAGAYVLVAPREYRSSALVELDAETDPLGSVDGLHPPPPPERESRDRDIEQMRSRSVVGPVVDRLGLAVLAEPRRLPFVGDAMARRYRGETPSPAPFAALSRYGFGGERITVSHIDVPGVLAGVPMTLVALGGGRYRLLDGDGREIARGEVGSPASVSATASGLDLLVSELVARPGTEFRVEAQRRDDVIDALQRRLVVAEKGRKSGLVELTLEGRDPRRVAAIVGALASEYVRQDAERRSGELTRTLDLYRDQLGTLRTRLEASENALTAFKAETGTADLSIETKAVIDRVVELQKQLSDLETARSELSSRRTDAFPDMRMLDARAAGIRNAIAALLPRVKELPGTELRLRRLTRDLTVITDQYVSTLNRIQTLQVMQAAATGDVRIVDAPVVARRAVSPQPFPALALALLLGAGAGVGLAFVRRVLAAADDSHHIEAATGLPIFVAVPHSEAEAKLQREARGGVRTLLAAAAPDDIATESVRTLRTVLGFLLNARGNVVSVTSPAPGSGKTFVTANLAHLLAAAGKKVLLVDADLRRGALHRYFSLEDRPGLSDVLGGAASMDEAIHRTTTAGLDVLVCGRPALHPADLLAGSRLDETLGALSKRYDVVIVDTAPTLAVTDAVLVARCAKLNLLVLRSRQDPVPEVSLALERFARSGVQVHGAIVNDVRPGGRYGRAYERRPGQGEAPVAALS